MELTKARVNGCLSKNSYPNRECAEMEARVGYEQRGVKLRVYPCQYGFHFHLTSKPKGFVHNRKKRVRCKLYL